MALKKALFIFGTRPEAIKLAPLIKEFEKHPDSFEVKVCVSAQHREMLDQVLSFFEITPDFDLDLMKPNQDLYTITAGVINGLGEVLKNYLPDVIFVQGDTTTAFVGALAGYYKKVKVAHVEAGLRSGNKLSPYPEEVNRILAGHIANYHFAPTPRAVENLKRESVSDNVWHVGNTVIDSLFLALEIIKAKGEDNYAANFTAVNFEKRVVLITGHRRESFGEPFRNICSAIKEISERFNDVEFVYPVHLNPNVQQPVNELLSDLDNVHLIEPLDYPNLVWLMSRCYLILTDSGGIQEEGPSLGKPVLVMREVTERQEGIDAGTAKLVGTDRDVIVENMVELLSDEQVYAKMANATNPYGDGSTSQQIADIILKTDLNE